MTRGSSRLGRIIFDLELIDRRRFYGAVIFMRGEREIFPAR